MDAEIRWIQVPTGSCSSLTKYFMPQWKGSLSSDKKADSLVPSSLATLLLSAILIDTAGLKKGGKATDTDYDSAAFLDPISSFPSGDASSALSALSTRPDLERIAQNLLNAKLDVSHLSTHDLLLRDYKEYNLPTSSASYPILRVGLSTVPQSLKMSLEKESSGWTSYLAAVEGYMAERNLDVEGVLTTYSSEKKGKHKRELLLAARWGAAFSDDNTAKRVLDSLSGGLEASTGLVLRDWERKGFEREIGEDGALVSEGSVGKVWEQRNANATRKQVAPILVSPCSHNISRLTVWISGT